MIDPVPDDNLPRGSLASIEAVNSSKADADDATLIERVELAAA